MPNLAAEKGGLEEHQKVCNATSKHSTPTAGQDVGCTFLTCITTPTFRQQKRRPCSPEVAHQQTNVASSEHLIPTETQEVKVLTCVTMPNMQAARSAGLAPQQ
jgi:hypothetical protein